MLSAAAPFKCGGRSGPYSYTDIAAGPLAIKDVADIYPYPNSLRVLKVDGATLREWLERAASIFRRIDPSGRDEQPLLGPAFAAYNFDVIDGVAYTIDVTQPARYDNLGELVAPDARRIRDLTFKARHRSGPVVSRRHQQLSRQRRRRLPGCDGTSVVIELGMRTARSAQVCREQNRNRAEADSAWRFARWPGAVVATYLTSPVASDLPAPPGLKLSSMGLAPGGFLKLRVETV